MPVSLSVCTLLILNDALASSIAAALSQEHYTVVHHHAIEEFYQFVTQEKPSLDCLILQDRSDLDLVFNWLHGQAVLLPAIIFGESTSTVSSAQSFRYHTAEVTVPGSALGKIDPLVKQAIAQFINLSPSCWGRINAPELSNDGASANEALLPQQQRLIEKLKERLGYLGVYYKRDPKNFYRHLSTAAKQELLHQLKQDYRDIVLCYFANDGTLNQRIDEYVNLAFFADIPTAQVVEIHMELIDDFSKQLKLEGRSEEVLLDYRLTLIDTIAHLCEMYRRSLPKEASAVDVRTTPNP